MKETVRLIGRAIREGSKHLPTRNLAASYASTAGPKDYYSQAKAIYDGFLNRWKYVRDPISREMLTAGPNASYRLVMAGDGIGVGSGFGAGDCDCATVALGSMYESTGFPVRIATVAREGSMSGQLMEHVYPEVYINKYGWVPADPVIYPKGGFGDESNYSRKAVYDLTGKMLQSTGNVAGLEDIMIPKIWNRPPMRTYSGLPNFSEYENNESYEPGEVIFNDFGSLAWRYGYIPGEKLGGLSADMENEDYEGEYVDTPILEVAPEDFEYMAYIGQPYLGMLGLSQDGSVYSFDGFSFKKILNKAKKAFKTIKNKVDKAIGKKKPSKAGSGIPIPSKVVKPILKQLRNSIKTLAPVAGIVPGMGPALKLGLEVAAKAPDQILSKDISNYLETLIKIDPTKVEDYQTAVQSLTKTKKNLKQATQRLKTGKKQLQAAKKQIRLLKKKAAGKTSNPEEIDIRATDALRMAQSLLQQQLTHAVQTQQSAANQLKTGKTAKPIKAVSAIKPVRAVSTQPTQPQTAINIHPPVMSTSSPGTMTRVSPVRR